MSSDVLRFSMRLLEQEGAAVEDGSGYVDALLPLELARQLGWNEEVRLVEDPSGERSGMKSVAYGTAGLEQLLDLVRLRGSVICLRAGLPTPALRDLVADARNGLRFRMKGPVAFGATTRSMASYLVVHYWLAAASEESHEGLIRVAVNESTLAPLQGLHAALEGLRDALHPGGVQGGAGSRPLPDVLQAASREARRLALRHLEPFMTTLERRRRRDGNRLHSYFESMLAETAARRGPGRASRRVSIEDRQNAVRAEYERKIRDLSLRYGLRVRLRPAALMRVTIPVLQAVCCLRWKTVSRAFPVTWNPILHEIEPLVCDACGCASREVVVDEDLRLTCAGCPGDPAARDPG
jgi:hypothetical protein